MTGSPPSIDDIQQALLERISAGQFPVGTRLPPVRRLAETLGSNPSTVDRALQRLSEAGLVRTVPRRGTYVKAADGPGLDRGRGLSDDLDRAVRRARASGMSADAIRAEFDEALRRAEQQPSIAFVECNTTDLERMAAVVENATGMELARVLLADAERSLLEEFEIVAAPLFHVADLTALGLDLRRVVELNFIPSLGALRELAGLQPDTAVTVAAPTRRGLDRFAALVRQYFPGSIKAFHAGHDESGTLDGSGTLVHSAASGLDTETVSRFDREILIEWELDLGSALSFRSRLDGALADGRSWPTGKASSDGSHKPWVPARARSRGRTPGPAEAPSAS